MSKPKTTTEILAEMNSGLETTRNETFKWDDNMVVEMTPVRQLYTDSVKEAFGMTYDKATEFNKFNAEFASTVLGHGAQALTDLVLNNDKIETLETTIEVAGLNLGLFYSKPMMDTPLRSDFEASIGFGVGVQLNDTVLNDARVACGNLWEAFNEEDDEDE